MLNVTKISGMLWKKKRCPICSQPLVETMLTGQKFTCRVSCPTCKISHEGYHFYDCYDALFNNVVSKIRAKIFKERKTFQVR